MNKSHTGGAQSGKKRVCVLGAGVIGLSTAVRILEDSKRWPGVSGVEVTVVADRYTPHTTSDASGGFWLPESFNYGNTSSSLIRKWSEATWDHMLQLAKLETAGTAGVQFVSGYHLTESPTLQDPSFKDKVFGYRPLTSQELSMFPKARSGYFMTSLHNNTRKYLPWLMQRFRSAGGRMESKTVNNLSQLAEDYHVVVNCAGLRAGQLVSDPHTLPIRGQIRAVDAPWIKHFYYTFDKEGNVSYLLPLGEEVLVGGIAQKNNWKEEVDDADSQDIWTRATALFPFLQDGRKVREWVGLRPGRSEVRLEADKVNTAGGRCVPVVHNYGHGGSGVTLHWGCAADAADLVHTALLQNAPPTHSKL